MASPIKNSQVPGFNYKFDLMVLDRTRPQLTIGCCAGGRSRAGKCYILARR